MNRTPSCTSPRSHASFARRIARLALIAAVSAGCGGTERPPDEPEDTTPLTIDTLHAATVHQFCKIFVRCGVVDDLATCETLNLDLGFDADLIAAVKAGKIVFHSDQARACLNSILPTSCDRSLVLTERGAFPACAGELEGTVARGGACGLDEECVSSTCDKSRCTGDTCCIGVCTGGSAPRPGKLGEACGNGACAEGFCDRTTDACVPYLKGGERCSYDDQCEIGLACEATCRIAPAPGEPCTRTYGCRDLGMGCNQQSNTCTALGLAGDSCRADDDCSSLYKCGAAGTCQLYPQLGEPCTGMCGDHSYCSEATSTCVEPQSDGATCKGGSQCASTYCDFDTDKCTARPICI